MLYKITFDKKSPDKELFIFTFLYSTVLLLLVREDTMVGPLRFYPPYTNGLVVNATFFFFSLIMPETDFYNFFFFFTIFGLKQPNFRKKWFFA